jgi:hypothetical protein
MANQDAALTVVEADGTKRPWSLNDLRHAVRVAVVDKRPLPGNNGADQLYVAHDGGLIQCAVRYLGVVIPGTYSASGHDECPCELVAVGDGKPFFGFTYPRFWATAFEYRRAGEGIDYDQHVIDEHCQLHCLVPPWPTPVRDRFGNLPNTWTEVRGIENPDSGFVHCEHCGSRVAHWPDY